MRFGSKPGQRSGLGLRRVCQECVIPAVTSSGFLAAPISLTILHPTNTITLSLISAASFFICIPQVPLSQTAFLTQCNLLLFPVNNRPAFPLLFTSSHSSPSHPTIFLITQGLLNSVEYLTLPHAGPALLLTLSVTLP